MLNYVYFPKGCTKIGELNYLQEWILIHCAAYYHIGIGLISDEEYEKYSEEYLEKISKCTQLEKEATRYWYVFNNYDGNTGFDLFGKLKDYDQDYIGRNANFALWVMQPAELPIR